MGECSKRAIGRKRTDHAMTLSTASCKEGLTLTPLHQGQAHRRPMGSQHICSGGGACSSQGRCTVGCPKIGASQSGVLLVQFGGPLPDCTPSGHRGSGYAVGVWLSASLGGQRPGRADLTTSQFSLFVPFAGEAVEGSRGAVVMECTSGPLIPQDPMHQSCTSV